MDVDMHTIQVQAHTWLEAMQLYASQQQLRKAPLPANGNNLPCMAASGATAAATTAVQHASCEHRSAAHRDHAVDIHGQCGRSTAAASLLGALLLPAAGCSRLACTAPRDLRTDPSHLLHQGCNAWGPLALWEPTSSSSIHSWAGASIGKKVHSMLLACSRQQAGRSWLLRRQQRKEALPCPIHLAPVGSCAAGMLCKEQRSAAGQLWPVQAVAAGQWHSCWRSMTMLLTGSAA